LLIGISLLSPICSSENEAKTVSMGMAIPAQGWDISHLLIRRQGWSKEDRPRRDGRTFNQKSTSKKFRFSDQTVKVYRS